MGRFLRDGFGLACPLPPYPTGRGRRLKSDSVWVRAPPGAPSRTGNGNRRPWPVVGRVWATVEWAPEEGAVRRAGPPGLQGGDHAVQQSDLQPLAGVQRHRTRTPTATRPTPATARPTRATASSRTGDPSTWGTGTPDARPSAPPERMTIDSVVQKTAIALVRRDRHRRGDVVLHRRHRHRRRERRHRHALHRP